MGYAKIDFGILKKDKKVNSKNKIDKNTNNSEEVWYKVRGNYRLLRKLLDKTHLLFLNSAPLLQDYMVQLPFWLYYNCLMLKSL